MEQTNFIHTVFFWLKEEVTEDQKQAFEKGMEDLGECPTILKWHYGKPAATDRDVIDNTYNYAWIVHFKNAADQETYQDEPIHHLFVERYSALWAKVQVYDSVLQSQK